MSRKEIKKISKELADNKKEAKELKKLIEAIYQA